MEIKVDGLPENEILEPDNMSDAALMAAARMSAANRMRKRLKAEIHKRLQEETERYRRERTTDNILKKAIEEANREAAAKENQFQVEKEMKNLSLANAAQKKARTAQQKRLEAENKVEELFTNQASKKKK